ncbi:MAG: DUF4347 domain-containing protein [Rubripirellula sp.]
MIRFFGSKRKRVRNQNQWSLSTLEKRLMLAADCGAAIGETAGVASAEVGSSAPITSQQSSQIVFIDAGVDAVDHLVDGVAKGHEIVLLQAGRSGLDQISETLAQRTNVSSIHIVAHGSSGKLELGNQQVDLETIDRSQMQLRAWAQSLTADADILLYGCETGADSRGLQFVQRMAELTGADVAASTDTTGAAAQNADWDLERHIGTIDAGLAFNDSARESYQAVLPITIRAAGSTGEEQMLLQIDGTTVGTFDNVSTNFQEYTYNVDGINADQVRVVFTNDLYDEPNGFDRNLRVDKITIDGVEYETEAPEVFSTGTWFPEDGVVPGNRESDTLHTNGYFQYAGTTVDPGGDPSLLVINEIHYNPGPDGVVDGDAEFVELYNSGDEAVNLGGMSFVGFDMVFSAGTTIGAGEYAIVAPSIALAESTWGVTPIAEFQGGGISGGGELLQLLAADGTVIDEVSYLDEAPWSSLPDGNGPSLELRDWALDNSDPTNWAPSTGDPTPAAENSIFGEEAVEPITDIVVAPGVVLPNQSFSISANIEGATTASLIYKVMFGEEQTVAMVNTGGDSWQATLPGADAGTLIRYRIESDVAVAPFNDTINYFGLVVSPTDITDNQLPLFQFFVDDAEFTELTTTDLALTNTKIAAVVYYNGDVIDNATVRVRGGDFSRQFYPKKSLKFELPKGQAIDVGAEGSYPIDEFAIQADFGDWSVVTPDISWDVFNNETDSFETSFMVRAEVNGDFHGVFRFQELYDGAWREANGIDDTDELYKADRGAFGGFPNFDKKSPDDGDFSTIIELNDVLALPSSEAKTSYLYDNVDVANVINHMALSALIRHHDQIVQNFYMLYDSETQLWSIVEWDLDRTWVRPSDTVNGDFTSTETLGHELFDAIWEVDEFRDMYWRRMQTIVDTYLSDDSLIDRRTELINQVGATNSSLEFAKWNRNDIFANPFWTTQWQEAIDGRRAAYAAETRMPGTASGSYDVVINELHYNPLDGDAEFIELYNRSTTESVDLSAWTIDGVNLTIGYGTVLLPGESVVFTDNFSRFRAQYPGDIFVAGEYSGGLSGGGELITLSDAAGNLIDSVEYDDTDPWPTEPDGNGFTLALTDPALDNSLASSWAASNQINGTPGAANDSTFESTLLKIYAAGTTGGEILALEVQGQQVAIFDLSTYGGQAGDFNDRNFVELSWVTETAIDPGDVRIYFTNDFVDREAGIDSNVKIDRIEIDGVVYETEAPDVFSTGSWLSADGIVPGFRQSENLHINGYFQFASVVSNEQPIAVNDDATTVAGSPVSGNLLTNDSDPDGNTISVVSNTDPANGTVNVQANGDYVYTPNTGFSGDDSFNYTITDGNDGTAFATVFVTVDPLIVLADGNVIQLLNFDYDAYLASINRNARTTTSNNLATHWELIDVGNGDFKLRNQNDNRYLDGDRFDIDTSSRFNAFGNIWRFIEYGGGQYYMYNVAYNDFLDANGRNASVYYDPGELDPDDRWIPILV